MRRLSIFGLLVVALGCADPFEINLPDYEPKVVIEGYIEQGEFPEVYLTLSSGFYDPVDSIVLKDYALPTARVKVSDGENEEILTLFADLDKFPPFYYRGTELRGEVGKTYFLEVISKGETYTAKTTIPAPVPLDSVWYTYNDQRDSIATLRVKFSDDPQTSDYYRTFTMIRSQDKKFIPVYKSVWGDKFFADGTITLSLLKGTASFSEISNDLYFSKGDTVSVKFCKIDQEQFDFWRTLERELHLAGNPFGSSGNEIISNVEGTRPALGVWGGYGASYHSIIIK